MNKSCNNVNILPDSFLHGKQILEDYFESFCPFSNREKTKVLNRLKFTLIKIYILEKKLVLLCNCFSPFFSFNVIGAILCESLLTVCISTVSYRVE